MIRLSANGRLLSLTLSLIFFSSCTSKLLLQKKVADKGSGASETSSDEVVEETAAFSKDGSIEYAFKEPAFEGIEIAAAAGACLNCEISMLLNSAPTNLLESEWIERYGFSIEIKNAEEPIEISFKIPAALVGEKALENSANWRVDIDQLLSAFEIDEKFVIFTSQIQKNKVRISKSSKEAEKKTTDNTDKTEDSETADTPVPLKSIAITGGTGLVGKCYPVSLSATGDDDAAYTDHGELAISFSHGSNSLIYSDATCATSSVSQNLAENASSATYYIKASKASYDSLTATISDVTSPALAMEFDTFIMFFSWAPTLVQTAGAGDHGYVRSVLKAENTQITVASGGGAIATSSDGNYGTSNVSWDGKYAFYTSDCDNCGATNGLRTIIRHELATQLSAAVSYPDGFDAVGSTGDKGYSTPDGNFMVFNSGATNLVAGDTNGLNDVFIKNISANTLVRVSVADDESQATGGDNTDMSVSDDGNIVAFKSSATNLTAGDTNGVRDIFVRVLDAQTTTIITLAHDGSPANGMTNFSSISGDGRFVAYITTATNIVDGGNISGSLFLHDRQTSQTTLISKAHDDGDADNVIAALKYSPDGKYIAFQTIATNIVTGDANGKEDIFLYDVAAGTTIKITNDYLGGDSDGVSGAPYFTRDSEYVYFDSSAKDLLPPNEDDNDAGDVYLYHIKTGTIERVSIANDGTEGNDESFVFTEI
jgi:hypothetical protein